MSRSEPSLRRSCRPRSARPLVPCRGRSAYRRVAAFAVAAFAVAAAPQVRAQTYDDFNGSVTSQKLWFRFGDLAPSSQSGGFLRFNGPKDTRDFGVYSVDALRGDFELVLDFQGFGSATTRGAPGLALSAFDAVSSAVVESAVEVGIRATPNGRQWFTEAENRGNSAGGARRTTTATAGRLRLRRRAGLIRAEVLERGASAWVVLRTWTDFYATNAVRFVIAAESGDLGNIRADCDKITTTGTRVPGAPSYGARCQGFGAATLGLPAIGTASFSLLATGGPRFAGAPVVFTIGTARTATDLGRFGAPGCSLYTAPVIVGTAPRADADGDSEFALPIPANPWLVGQTLFVQSVAVANVNRLGVAMSNGIELKITR